MLLLYLMRNVETSYNASVQRQSQSIKPHKPEQGDDWSGSFVLVLCGHNAALFMEPGQQRSVICIDMSYYIFTTVAAVPPYNASTMPVQCLSKHTVQARPETERPCLNSLEVLDLRTRRKRLRSRMPLSSERFSICLECPPPNRMAWVVLN